MKRPPASLRSRALAWLAQREHSRSELRRKLLRLAQQHAERAAGSDDSCDDVGGAARDPSDRSDPTEPVEALLDWLEARAYLSDERFVESRVRVRAAGLGTRRIQGELARHGLKLDAQPLQALRDSELQRARLLWQRKFGSVPANERERARQMRFLAGRGFPGEVIRCVLSEGGRTEAADDA